MEIKLERAVWQFDESERLGPKGGFGEVFKCVGPDGPVAIKRLLISATEAAHRELNIGRKLAAKTSDHVVPVLDYGQDADSDRYFLVMPVCEESLQDKLTREGPLAWDASQPIILDIVSGLLEVGDVVHRDLKPGNVLRHDGRWKIADFGIAKFVEDSTSLQTLRDVLTPSYAAPEQWLGQRPTAATDVYALGCIIHAIVNGKPPFSGDLDSVRDAHQHNPPPVLIGVDPRLASLVNAMLRKAPEVRPNLDRCKRVISETKQPQGVALSALAEAALRVSQEEAIIEAQKRELETARLNRAKMVKEAIGGLHSQFNRLFDEIAATSELVHRTAQTIVLGRAHLKYADPRTLHDQAASVGSGWDVAAASAISLRCEIENPAYHEHGTYTFSASLVFSKTPEDIVFRWREVSFWSFRTDHHTSMPFALDPEDLGFRQALSNVVSSNNVAHGPLTIDAEDENGFLERWIGLFAKAAIGNLRNPNQMPPPASFFSG